MMSTGEHQQPPLNGRQQRNPEEEAHQGYLGASTQGTFLLPADNSQTAFAFSAEPAMIDYSSMVSLTPSSGAQDSVFTPNTGSSFDSSLHRDHMNLSYPPANFMHAQSYGLSPVSNSRTGQSISPSHSVDHLSPDAGYLSDPNNHDFNAFTANNFNDHQYVSGHFPNSHYADDGNVFDISSMGMSLPITPDVLGTFNAQNPQMATNSQTDAHAMISPCPTNGSSPVVTQDFSNNANMSRMPLANQDVQTSSSPPAVLPGTAYSTPRKQQHSPALTNSSGAGGVANAQTLPAHLASPIVRVENYGGAESPAHSDASRPVSKRSHGSRRSGNHLSPFPADESSDDDDDDRQEQVRVQSVVRSVDRTDDGSWLPSPSGGGSQAGLSPDERRAMGNAWVPTIEELAEMRRKEDKENEVRQWLTKSEAASEAGDDAPAPNLLRPFPHRQRARAKSANDAHRQPFSINLGLGVVTDFDRPDDSGIPGPGALVDVNSEYDDYDEDDDEAIEPESPPAEVDEHANADDYFPVVEDPSSLEGVTVRPWIDGPSHPPTTATHFQPQTSNAAMMRFRQRAKDVETASLAATLGSRRLSESDLGSIRAAPGVIKAIEPDLKKQKDRQRRPSFLENLIPKRGANLKRKTSMPVQQPPPESAVKEVKEITEIKQPKRIGSWGRPKSPRLDTSVAGGKEIDPPSATNLSATAGPWYQGAKNAIKRSRSRSDLGKSPGLAELMTQHGGPPMPTLVSPLAETGTEATKPTPQPSPGGDDDEDEAPEAVTMDLKVRSDPIIPTPDGFKQHARQLNPRLVDYMVDRITQEQLRRYKRLLEFKVKHLNAVKNRNCSSGKYCTELGGAPKQLPPRAGNKDSDAPFIGFQITAPGSSDDDGEAPPEGTVVSAQFPSGVPLPPVKRLPAEFECPLCFKIKKFYKPSDWTKHVHEDVQPFTCTFPNCGEPKSFKRKADWVRHENERHRQLENWTCQIADCNHTCYRKDNFVQHLVREHKIAEPRSRTGRTANRDAPPVSETDDIWSLVERCRRDTTKQPRDEPCRFCGNICTSWKKLTVHLAKHMEQISMPILPLVEQKQINADTIISPVTELPESRKLSATPNRSPIDNPSRYNPKANSTLAPGIDPSFGQFPHDISGSAVASNVMHTYPPPQFMNFKAPQAQSKGGYNNYAVESTPIPSGQTYPGLQGAPKARGAYINGQQLSVQPYVNNEVHNNANRYPMTPISAIGPHQTNGFTSSPVDSTSYTTDTMGSAYFTREPQAMGNGNGGISDLGLDTNNGLQYNPSAYQDMSYMNPPQHNYPYQG